MTAGGYFVKLNRNMYLIIHSILYFLTVSTLSYLKKDSFRNNYEQQLRPGTKAEQIRHKVRKAL